MSENETETVDELTADMTGRWLVTTQGSTHVWDLDAWTYTRRPGRGRGNFQGDGVPQRIWCVKAFPKVGESFYVALDDTATRVQTRVSTEVARIERLSDPQPDAVKPV
ncbi:hypothetical protein [Mycolicibacterium fallax]|uniref:hypothetical protein n=1 Tax=Mycolicibacterium fallax TaxID=1793 RepID=UPI001054EE17|nr:hypothetical protein [Mycolicibacterium fallax]BBY98354.1 hypothetical protein MFAL_18210 [Mycolicibacterium fallax]